MEDKLDTILLRLSKLQKSVDALKATMDATDSVHIAVSYLAIT